MSTRGLLTGLVVAMGCAVVGVVAYHKLASHHAIHAIAESRPVETAVIRPISFPAPAGEASAKPVESAPPVMTPAPAPPGSVSTPTPTPSPTPVAKKTAPSIIRTDAGKPILESDLNTAIPLPVARQALDFVGADPEAEDIWLQAINDPNMSKPARSDLIEDLNENGFPDPRHVTMDDLPLIASRLQLIEELAPDAMDQTNLDAFMEAYKDLLNMYASLTGW